MVISKFSKLCVTCNSEYHFQGYDNVIPWWNSLSVTSIQRFSIFYYWTLLKFFLCGFQGFKI